MNFRTERRASLTFGTLQSRRRFLYWTHAALAIPFFVLWRQQPEHALLLALGTAHIAAHHLWPYITATAVDPRVSVFPDIALHLAMAAAAHSAFLSTTAEEHVVGRAVSWLVLVGTGVNMGVAGVVKLDSPWFQLTSAATALSVGSWLGFLIGGGEAWLWAAALVNWVYFVKREDEMCRWFGASYFDTLILFGVWIYIWRSGGLW